MAQEARADRSRAAFMVAKTGGFLVVFGARTMKNEANEAVRKEDRRAFGRGKKMRASLREEKRR